ncbi:hypothetical protein L1987_85867 [Smallanthus sonchifolius]|uniref:Uncharacterized protein n=1 Tax=Smallanthus sonchifolius TaxID=185202 RepID=A0ACB8XYG3_9ASTR|nr:hypothetical protein L1987_85867 [Smallanthus sonchifolius]
MLESVQQILTVILWMAMKKTKDWRCCWWRFWRSTDRIIIIVTNITAAPLSSLPSKESQSGFVGLIQAYSHALPTQSGFLIAITRNPVLTFFTCFALRPIEDFDFNSNNHHRQISTINHQAWSLKLSALGTVTRVRFSG